MVVLERKRRMVHRYDDGAGETKKGPWKAEEDQVLINHVKKHGPRDWSSIQSKGLLQRTGKSCRLRWVNKLRPNLKSGMKFTAEEERMVIELQSQFGNKWAKISTYLSGRTDNDVKNFWSSRQKRLARLLQSSGPSSSRSQKTEKSTSKDVKAPIFHSSVPSEESYNQASEMKTESMEGEKVVKSQPCSSSHIGHSGTLKVVPLPELVYPSMLSYEHIPYQFDYFYPDVKPLVEMEPQPHTSFPAFPQLQPDFPFLFESQEYMPRLGNPNFLDVFEYTTEPPLITAQLPISPSSFGLDTNSHVAEDQENHNGIPPDVFIDDFPPIDMFDPIEPLPSPSEWS